MLEIKKGGSNKERKKIRVEESYKGGSLYRAQFIKRNRHAIKNKLARAQRLFYFLGKDYLEYLL